MNAFTSSDAHIWSTVMVTKVYISQKWHEWWACQPQPPLSSVEVPSLEAIVCLSHCIFLLPIFKQQPRCGTLSASPLPKAVNTDIFAFFAARDLTRCHGTSTVTNSSFMSMISGAVEIITYCYNKMSWYLHVHALPIIAPLASTTWFFSWDYHKITSIRGQLGEWLSTASQWRGTDKYWCTWIVCNFTYCMHLSFYAALTRTDFEADTVTLINQNQVTMTTSLIEMGKKMLIN